MTISNHSTPHRLNKDSLIKHTSDLIFTLAHIKTSMKYLIKHMQCHRNAFVALDTYFSALSCFVQLPKGKLAHNTTTKVLHPVHTTMRCSRNDCTINSSSSPCSH
eukprot:4645069-Amphidinium_carterae.1